MRRQRLNDWLRRGLILLLLVSAVLLLRRTGYFDGLRGRFAAPLGIGTEPAAAGALSRTEEALLPVSVTVCADSGSGRFGVQYDDASVEAVVRGFSVDLGEALGSAGVPVPCTEEEFRACLDGCSLALRFVTPVPLELLAGWQGVEMSSEAAGRSAQMLCLSVSDARTRLSCRTAEGDCFLCATAMSAEGFRSRAGQYAPNGALYAWESDRVDGGGDLLLLTTPVRAAEARSSVPLVRATETDAMLTAFGMNRFVASSYSEADGTAVFISEDSTLRIRPTGEVSFRRAGTPEAGEAGALTEAVSRALAVAEPCIVPTIGDGALRFAGATENADQRTVTVQLDYALDGIPVRLTEGHAAEIVLRGGRVLMATLQLRQFTRTIERSQLLPWLQAAAIAGSAGGTPELIYADAGASTECMWVIADG